MARLARRSIYLDSLVPVTRVQNLDGLPARIINKSFGVTLIFIHLTHRKKQRKSKRKKEKNPTEDFIRRLFYLAATAKAPRKITQVGLPAGRPSERSAAEGCRVFLAARGRDNKEQVVARARSYSRHSCHVGLLVGLEETVRRGVEEENDERERCVIRNDELLHEPCRCIMNFFTSAFSPPLLLYPLFSLCFSAKSSRRQSERGQ